MFNFTISNLLLHLIDDRRRSTGGPGSQYGDSHQLFLGNLPHSATEDDLRDIFSKFGSIVDLRIHSKPTGKGMPGTRVPNYGFITYEDQQSVQNCLNARVSFFHISIIPLNSISNFFKILIPEKGIFNTHLTRKYIQVK